MIHYDAALLMLRAADAAAAFRLLFAASPLRFDAASVGIRYAGAAATAPMLSSAMPPPLLPMLSPRYFHRCLCLR